MDTTVFALACFIKACPIALEIRQHVALAANEASNHMVPASNDQCNALYCIFAFIATRFETFADAILRIVEVQDIYLPEMQRHPVSLHFFFIILCVCVCGLVSLQAASQLDWISCMQAIACAVCFEFALH